MATRKCINGHIYDPSVYGDNCPFCPQGGRTIVNGNEAGGTQVNAGGGYGGGTQVNAGGGYGGYGETIGGTAPTIPVQQEAEEGGTVIRHLGGSCGETGGVSGNRKLVGLLVCYDLNPLGEVYKIFEGRNIVGRKATANIVLSGDSQISSEHLIILYREAEGVFWAVDNNSSNGTFVNGSFENKVQLKTNDVITIGNTRLIFIAIPRFDK